MNSLARPSAGKGPIALIDRCPHRAAALSEGRMTSSGNLQCAYHGVGPECFSHLLVCFPYITLQRTPCAKILGEP